MEGIGSIDELFDSIKDFGACEGMIRLFNILCPYHK